MMRHSRYLAVSALLLAAAAPTARAADADKTQAAIDRGLAWLKAHQQPDGGWTSPSEPPAITALAVKAFAGDAGKVDRATLDKGYAAIVATQQPDGGLYHDTLANYNTAIAVTALTTADGKYKPQVDKAVAFLRTLQWGDAPADNKQAADQRAQVPPADPRYGGFGYGDHKSHPTGRPDGSNVQIALDALHDAGVKPTDPAFQAALAFESRLQNRSESNDQPWAGNDGGFIYTDAENGNSYGGTYVGPDGRRMFRSYGTMTYAGLKSMMYAGLTHDDPRVKAAWDWITKNWTFDVVPSLARGPGVKPEQGLFYYFHTAARALAAYGEPVVTDAQGNKHDWRDELSDKLLTMQRPDGSWAGEKRWMENNPVLCTSIAVLCLEQAKADRAAHPVK